MLVGTTTETAVGAAVAVVGPGSGHASIGSPYADVGRCRVNLAHQFGQDAADRFLAIYQDRTGRQDYHPYWDIVAATSSSGRRSTVG